MKSRMGDRRQWLLGTAGALVAGGTIGWTGPDSQAHAKRLEHSTAARGTQDAFASLRYCFNTATLRGKKLPITELIDLVADAGYDGIEVWIDELDRHVSEGGTLKDLKQRCDDRGLKVESAIAFANWLAVDPEQAKAEREKAKADMEKVAALGGRCIAAPPAGPNQPIQDWDLAAIRLAELAAVGKQAGVQPQLEVWGFSQAIGNLSQAMRLATATDSQDFGLLLDVYHLYKGGSSFESLRWVSGRSMQLFHMNDYPAQPGRDEISDGDRVFPGLGVAPMSQILTTLVEQGFAGALSLELFNREYWEKPADWVVQTGLESMKKVVEAAKSEG